MKFFVAVLLSLSFSSCAHFHKCACDKDKSACTSCKDEGGSKDAAYKDCKN